MNITGSPDFAPRIRIVSDPGAGCSSDLYRQFNTAAFQGPLVGSVGLESGNDYLFGCFQSVLDLSIARNIRLGGSPEPAAAGGHVQRTESGPHHEPDHTNCSCPVRPIRSRRSICRSTPTATCCPTGCGPTRPASGRPPRSRRPEAFRRTSGSASERPRPRRTSRPPGSFPALNDEYAKSALAPLDTAKCTLGSDPSCTWRHPGGQTPTGTRRHEPGSDPRGTPCGHSL